MNHSSIMPLLILWLLVFVSCQSLTHEDEPMNIDRECYIEIDTLDFTFGIEYLDFNTYLISGDQSDLADSNLTEVINAIGEPTLDIDGIINVCHWVNLNFDFQNAGGSMIGVPSVDDLFHIKTIYGCHSAALIISSVLRETGFPVVMIETASVDWAFDYHSGATRNFYGHVMCEVYVQGKWVLVDNNGTYIEDYDPLNPYLNTADGVGYFAYAKGVDTWEYTSRDASFTHNQMIFLAENVNCFEDMFETVVYDWSF